MTAHYHTIPFLFEIFLIVDNDLIPPLASAASVTACCARFPRSCFGGPITFCRLCCGERHCVPQSTCMYAYVHEHHITDPMSWFQFHRCHHAPGEVLLICDCHTQLWNTAQQLSSQVSYTLLQILHTCSSCVTIQVRASPSMAYVRGPQKAM